jgi:hypothetical protein
VEKIAMKQPIKVGKVLPERGLQRVGEPDPCLGDCSVVLVEVALNCYFSDLDKLVKQIG